MEPTPGAADRREQQAQLQALVQEQLFRRWRAVLAWILMAAGGVAILIGWYQVRDLPEVFLQMPYLISGGVGGAVLIGLGAALLITQDFRDDKQRLLSLERKISEMEDRSEEIEIAAHDRPGDVVARALRSKMRVRRLQCQRLADLFCG